MRTLLARSFVLAVVSLFAASTFATSAAADPLATEGFTRVPALEPNVAFWKKVYIEWGLNNIAFHDEQDLGTVYRVIRVPGRGEKSNGVTRAEAISRGKAEVEAALRSLARKNPKSNESLTGVEREVFDNLKHITRADKYTRLGTLRVQNGLRERFLQGWANSGLYEEFIEAELRRNGLPDELIGIAFVESLFYVGARSHVGAAGVWQFMSYTGKEYMQLNAVVDERYDPILATEAACKYLKQAKKELGTWPLAVTSYNYGRAGMKNLAKDAGTKDFGVILNVSRNKRFGFAARNYYASFMAVHDILKQRDKLLAGVERKKPWSYEVIRAPFPMYSTQLLATGELDMASFDSLNPGLTVAARDGKIPLPHGISLRVPRGKSARILQKLAALSERERTRAGRAVKTVHTASGKQSVAEVAKKFGLTPDTLASAVGLSASDVPAKGQGIPIPHIGARYTLFPEARGMPVPPLPAPQRILLADAEVMSDEPQKPEVKEPAKAEPAATVALAKEAAKEPEGARGRVKIGRITVEPVGDMLPAVDVIAGMGTAALPPVDAIAGDPGATAPWIIPDAPTGPAVAAR